MRPDGKGSIIQQRGLSTAWAEGFFVAKILTAICCSLVSECNDVLPKNRKCGWIHIAVGLKFQAQDGNRPKMGTGPRWEPAQDGNPEEQQRGVVPARAGAGYAAVKYGK